ncbi:MAG TPA: protein phosphatase 2C domain-containing protein [Polyangia bacterium]|nr:protein phosphatase 2C domain-containing protein [Polyangia bacterium]
MRETSKAPTQPPVDRPHRMFTVCGGTNVGSRRAENQDTFVITDLETGRVSRPCIRTEVWVSRPGVLMLVCDGMGGRAAGDVAAQLAAASIKQELRAQGDSVGQSPDHSLKRAVLGANQAILDEAEAHPAERGMGTTCTAALISPDRLAIVQVGDSRAYLLREGRLRTLTRDQTLAADLVDRGALKPEDVAHFPYRHVLAQALGTGAEVSPVVSNVDLQEGDRVLLCSDGLHGPVPAQTIEKILSGTRDPAQVAEELIAAALAAGGPDNVTVVVADCGPLSSRRNTTPGWALAAER